MRALTLGYLNAVLMAAAVLFSMGWLLLPLLPLLLVWHGLRSRWGGEALARAHEAFLLRSYLILLLLLGLLYALPIAWGVAVLDPESEAAAVIGTRDPEAIVHWLKLWAADTLREPSMALAGHFAGALVWLAMHATLSAVIGIYFAVRVLRRFIRWSERRAVDDRSAVAHGPVAP